MSEPSTVTEPQARKAPVAIDRVVELEETRDIRPVDREHVERLALAVDHLPPIDVVKLTGGRFGVLAGYHRVAAHHLAGKTKIRVAVWDLAVEDWHPFAVRSNLTHGLPLTLKQRKAAAKRMLEDNPHRSDRVIATDCGLSHPTIAKLRQPDHDDDPTGKDFQLDPASRVGRDGKTRRMPAPRDSEDRQRRELTDEEQENVLSKLVELEGEIRANDAASAAGRAELQAARLAGMLEEEPELPLAPDPAPALSEAQIAADLHRWVSMILGGHPSRAARLAMAEVLRTMADQLEEEANGCVLMAPGRNAAQ